MTRVALSRCVATTALAALASTAEARDLGTLSAASVSVTIQTGPLRIDGQDTLSITTSPLRIDGQDTLSIATSPLRIEGAAPLSITTPALSIQGK